MNVEPKGWVLILLENCPEIASTALVAALVYQFYAAHLQTEADNAKWEHFRALNHCKVVEVNARSGQAYLCDDGIKYWR